LSAEIADCGREADGASDVAAGDEDPDEAKSEAAEGGKPRGGPAASAPRAALKN